MESAAESTLPEQPAWAQLDDEQLLEMRLRKLGLRIEGSGLEPYIQQLYDELSAKGLVFHPPCHFGDEWFVPLGIPTIFIPFYLAHDRLRDLERRYMLEVEGDTHEWFMMLIRHEAAHAYSYAYNLYRKRKWQNAFGLASTSDTGFYRPRPYSHNYVVHLEDWYAQAHPDEDFAETFAVWLTPDSNWQEHYQGWGAMYKLEYVDELMTSLAGMPPINQPRYRVAEYDCMGVKLKTYFARKRKLYADSYPDFYDADLKALFSGSGRSEGSEPAAKWLRRNRRVLINAVCTWTNERKYRVDTLIRRLIERCATLELTVSTEDATISLRLASYITTLVMNYLFTGKFARNK